MGDKNVKVGSVLFQHLPVVDNNCAYLQHYVLCTKCSQTLHKVLEKHKYHAHKLSQIKGEPYGM